MDKQGILKDISTFMAIGHGVVGAIVILGVTLVIGIIVSQAFRFLVYRSNKANHQWQETFLGAASTPLVFLIWIIGITISIESLIYNTYPDVIESTLVPIRSIGTILMVAWFLMRAVGRGQETAHQRTQIRGRELDTTAADAISKLMRAAIVLLTILVILQERGVSIAGILAFGGVGGIAIGFAAQSLVANLLGGLTVYASRIFKIGDDIILPGTNLSGTVQHIGWRATRVVGWDGKPFYVPNAYFNNSSMINNSRLERRSFTENVQLRYEDLDKVEAIIKDGNAALAKRKDLNYCVLNFNRFGDRSLELNIYAWPQSKARGQFLPYAEFARIKQEVLLTVSKVVNEHGGKVIPISHLKLQDRDADTSENANNVSQPAVEPGV